MTTPLPIAHLLTCSARAESLAATLASWRETDWGGEPRIFCDAEPERAGEEWGRGARARRLTDAFAGLLRLALQRAGAEEEWLFFLEDDVVFHPQIGAAVGRWAALGDLRCGLASVFNPSLAPCSRWGEMDGAFAAEPGSFLGAQALLLRRWAVRRALAKWESVAGLQSQRLARILGDEGPIWIHQPSLVQHVAEGSSWGARVQRALDFQCSPVAPQLVGECSATSPEGCGTVAGG